MVARAQQGQQVYYDPVKNQYYTTTSVASQYGMGLMGWPSLYNMQGTRTYIGSPTDSSSNLYGKNLNQGPTEPLPIPSYMPAGLQVYGSEPVTPAARPTPQTRPGVAPQFDMSFLQQLMAQRAQQPAAPAGPPTLTPGQQYGNPAMGGGLAALRAIAGLQPAAPTAPVSPTTGV